jgi:hypothetical protein
MSYSSPQKMRLYSCLIDGQVAFQAFPVFGEPSPDPDADALHVQIFHQWLESVAPGSLAAGRVAAIRCVDYMD